MKLYVGGAYQGQEELARQENPDAEILSGFEETVREWLTDGLNPREETLRLCQQHPHAVITANEIGCGIVPMNAHDRAWREAAGRALCLIAEKSEQVVRVTMGIGRRIK